MQKKIYILENLGCANCAAKIEKKIIELPGVEEAILTYSTKQLRLTAEDPDSYIEEIQRIARSYEPEITIKERKRRGSVAQIHRQEESCGCGHDHHHEDSCSCGHDHHQEESTHHPESGSINQDLGFILAGAALFVIGQFLPKDSSVNLLLFVAAYLILGFPIIKTAFLNLKNGQVFDENFLMTIATLGAFAIKEYPEAVGVMLFFRIGEYFEHRAVEKSRNSIMEAIDMRPETVTLIFDGQTRTIPAENAIPGDILLVGAGERIPLDGTVIEGTTRIDTSAVTGEPVPVAVKTGDSILSGCINLSGTIHVRVEKPLSESMVTRILDSVETAAASKPKMERFITRFSRIYTPVVVFAAAFTAIVPSLFTGDWNYWIYTALTFLVISCPCALVLSVPLAFFSGIGAGSSKGILFKGGLSLEAIEHVKAIVMDKTGTITKGTFEVKDITTFTEEYDSTSLLRLCAACEMTSSHPIGGSILNEANRQGLELEQPDFIEELAGKGIHAIVDGQDIYCGNQILMKEQGVDCSNFTPSSYGTTVLIGNNDILLGAIVIEDEVKPDSKEAIEKLHKAGLKTVMLTGDDETNAKAIAEKTGVQRTYSRLLPEDKLSILQEIRKEYGPVMYIGDGINDAPVLAGADVGAAMGNGADAAIEAADVVFMNKDLSSVDASISISKASTKVAKQNIIFALFIKVCVIILGFLGIANMWFAVFADSGVAMICVLNSVRVLYQHRKSSK